MCKLAKCSCNVQNEFYLIHLFLLIQIPFAGWYSVSILTNICQFKIRMEFSNFVIWLKDCGKLGGMEGRGGMDRVSNENIMKQLSILSTSQMKNNISYYKNKYLGYLECVFC